MKRSAPRQPSRAPRTPPSQSPGPGAARAGLRRMCAIREGPPRQLASSVGRADASHHHARRQVGQRHRGPVRVLRVRGAVHAWAGTEALKIRYERPSSAGNGPRDRSALRGGGPRERPDPDRLRGVRRPLVVRRARRPQAGRRRPDDEPRPVGSHLQRGLRRRRRAHEIGHTIGFPHEHQNPNAGIVWDEEAVYRALGGPPNNWSRETTFHNIIRKIQPDRVQGSTWDPDSVMHYPFEPD